LLGLPTLALVAIAVCTAVLWSAHGAPVLVAALGALLSVATVTLLSRTCMAVTAMFLRERRSRELSGLFVLTIVVVVVPVAVFLLSLEWRGAVPTQLSEAVLVLGYTPFGAAWALPAAVAAGSAHVGIVSAVAVVTVLLLLAAWLWCV